jgi:hypothetical protein
MKNFWRASKEVGVGVVLGAGIVVAILLGVLIEQGRL